MTFKADFAPARSMFWGKDKRRAWGGETGTQRWGTGLYLSLPEGRILRPSKKSGRKLLSGGEHFFRQVQRTVAF